ncbi:MAG TPA: hypothetical protein VMZ28_06885 [Kofleriaceae bacterium]|nr:hypothetical protein [Kofleriaceae bacterium]
MRTKSTVFVWMAVCAAGCEGSGTPSSGASVQPAVAGSEGAAGTAGAGGSATPTVSPAGSGAGSYAPDPQAPSNTGPPPDSFDYRTIRLQPSLVGSQQTCDIVSVEVAAKDRAIASCWNGWEPVRVDLRFDPQHAALAERLRRRARIKVEVLSSGDDHGGPEAVLRLLELVRDPPDNSAPPPRPPAPGRPPGSEAAFDFNRVNREPGLHNTEQVCLVRSTERVGKVDPKAGKGDVAGWLSPDQAAFFVRTTCVHGGQGAESHSRVIVGAPKFQPLLQLRQDALVKVKVLHDGRYPQREAVAVFTAPIYTPPAPAEW